MIAICHNCKGNGYIKIKNEEDQHMYVHQCWQCESKGEIKHEDSDSYWNYITYYTWGRYIFNVFSNLLHNC